MKSRDAALAHLAQQRAGVVRSRDAVALGATRSWLARRVSSGRWQRLHQGVLLTHSGPVPWSSRAWAALLYADFPSALSHEAAAYLHGATTRAPDIIDVALPGSRKVAPSSGLRLHRHSVMPSLTGWPMRTSLPETAIDLLSTADRTDGVLGWLSTAVRAGASPREIRRELLKRPRVRHRRAALELLAEVSAGIESPLEGRFHRNVERAHGLPAAELQVRQLLGDMWVRADRVYVGFGVRVELDGALAHPRGRTDRDTWRDNAALIHARDLTLRYRWSHVTSTPCDTAVQVLAALRVKAPSLGGHPCRTPTCPIR